MKKRAETLEQFLERASGVLFPDDIERPRSISFNSKSCDGDTPLHIAALWGDRHAALLLLDMGADVNAKGDMGCSPLYFAIMNNHVLVADVLLKRGADPDAKNELNRTPRELAKRSGDKRMVALFRQYKPTRSETHPNR